MLCKATYMYEKPAIVPHDAPSKNGLTSLRKTEIMNRLYWGNKRTHNNTGHI